MGYGSILSQKPSASNVVYSNAQTSSIITSDNVQGAIDQLFTSVSNGKSLIAGAITDMGVSTSDTDSWETMAGNIRELNSNWWILKSNQIFNYVENNDTNQLRWRTNTNITPIGVSIVYGYYRDPYYSGSVYVKYSSGFNVNIPLNGSDYINVSHSIVDGDVNSITFYLSTYAGIIYPESFMALNYQ